MKIPDKTEHTKLRTAKRIEEIHSEILIATRDRDTKRRKALTDELHKVLDEQQAAHTAKSIFTCAQCGQDFQYDNQHVDFVINSILFWDQQGVKEWLDDGSHRRFKFCDTCVSGWAIRPKDYAQMR